MRSFNTALTNVFPFTTRQKYDHGQGNVFHCQYGGNSVPARYYKKLLSCNWLPSPGYILIAEDDEDDQLLLSSAFAELKGRTELKFVENGFELLDHFQKYENGLIKNLPSLLVVDLNMPKKNGREAMAELRQKPYITRFPSVVFSTTGNDMERQRCMALGFSAYFVKPANYTSLVQVASNFCHLARLKPDD